MRGFSRGYWGLEEAEKIESQFNGWLTKYGENGIFREVGFSMFTEMTPLPRG